MAGFNTDEYNNLLMMHCIYCLRKTHSVTQYTIGNFVVKSYPLDAMVVSATLKNEEKVTFPIKVVNSNSTMNERFLCQNTTTSLYKSHDFFKEISRITLWYPNQIIFWTNVSFCPSIRDWFSYYVPGVKDCDPLGEGPFEGLSYERMRIKCGEEQSIAQKCLEYLRKRNEKHANRMDVPSESALQHILTRIVFYVNVPKVHELKSNLARKLGNHFDGLCELVKRCEVGKFLTSSRIDRLFTLVDLRNGAERGPYAKLFFSDLDELQRKVKELFDNSRNNILRVKASQDVECTVARLIPLVENCLPTKSKSYLTLSFKTFDEEWQTIPRIVNDLRIIGKEINCFIISSITDDEVSKIENQLPEALKVIFVGSELETDFDDKFDCNSLDDSSKDVIKNRKIKLSQYQSATASDILGEELFQKENYSMVLKLYDLHEDSVLLVTVNEQLPDVHFRPRYIRTGYEFVDLLNQNKFSTLVICDPPGMGKTTELIKLCRDFKEKHQDHLIVYLHCRAAVSKWNGNVEDLICNAVKGCSKLTYQVVAKIIQLGKVILLLDGYDEACEEYNNTLKSLISKVYDSKLFKFYISTEPRCKFEVKNILELHSNQFCNIASYFGDDLLTYLKNIWNFEKLDYDKQLKLEANGKSICNEMIDFNKYLEEPIIGIPLQTHLIAVTYKDRVFLPDHNFREFPFIIESMYKDFIELKFKEFAQRHFDPTNALHEPAIKNLKEAFLHDYIVAALRVSHIEVPSEVVQPCAKIEHFGITPLLHHTFADYFLALHLLTYSSDISSVEHYMSKFLEGSNNLMVRFMDFLLNHIDPSVKPNRSIHKSVCAYDIPEEYVPHKTARLHPEKMIEFHAALYNWSAAKLNKLLQKLREMHLNNMVELIYDSLRVEIRSRVRLCLTLLCRHKPGRIWFCFIPYKLNGTVESTIWFFGMFFKKAPDTFVTQYVTSLESEDFLVSMCSYDYSELFEWFTKLAPKLNEDQRTALTSFVEERLEKLLGMCCYKVNLIKAIAFWFRNTWTKQEAQQILEKHKILAMVIHHGWDSYERIETLEVVFDVFCWVYGETMSFHGRSPKKLTDASDKSDFLNAIQSTLDERRLKRAAKRRNKKKKKNSYAANHIL